jgi:hypothetical protein
MSSPFVTMVVCVNECSILEPQWIQRLQRILVGPLGIAGPPMEILGPQGPLGTLGAPWAHGPLDAQGPMGPWGSLAPQGPLGSLALPWVFCVSACLLRVFCVSFACLRVFCVFWGKVWASWDSFGQDWGSFGQVGQSLWEFGIIWDSLWGIWHQMLRVFCVSFEMRFSLLPGKVEKSACLLRVFACLLELGFGPFSKEQARARQRASVGYSKLSVALGKAETGES